MLNNSQPGRLAQTQAPPDLAELRLGERLGGDWSLRPPWRAELYCILDTGHWQQGWRRQSDRASASLGACEGRGLVLNAGAEAGRDGGCAFL